MQKLSGITAVWPVMEMLFNIHRIGAYLRPTRPDAVRKITGIGLNIAIMVLASATIPVLQASRSTAGEA